jgi:hypothetical protein
LKIDVGSESSMTAKITSRVKGTYILQFDSAAVI